MQSFFKTAAFVAGIFVMSALAACGGGDDAADPAINQAPTANFSASATSLLASFDASASSDADGSISSYRWSFGDGTVRTTSSPTTSHVFAASGTHTVNLVVLDAEGAASSVHSRNLSVAPPPSSARTRYIVTADGTQVTDTVTWLVWPRCSPGQSWSAAASTCTGTVAKYTYESALAMAQDQPGWRLPTIKELSSISDLTKNNPAVDETVFPATPSAFYYSATLLSDQPDPRVSEGQAPYTAWMVHFRDGFVYYGGLWGLFPVRLVRSW